MFGYIEWLSYAIPFAARQQCFQSFPASHSFPACQFAEPSSPASRRLESRPNWQTGTSAPHCRPATRLANLGFQVNLGYPSSVGWVFGPALKIGFWQPPQTPLLREEGKCREAARWRLHIFAPDGAMGGSPWRSEATPQGSGLSGTSATAAQRISNPKTKLVRCGPAN
jgi:hypothetical protein